MLKRKKREFHSSELLQSFAKLYGFENKLLALEIKEFLLEFINENYSNEIKSVNITDKFLVIRVQSPMLRNDFQLKKSYYLSKIQEKFGENTIIDLEFI